MLFLPPEEMPNKRSSRLPNNSPSKRRERMMPLRNLPPPQLERNKRKKSVNYGEPNMLMTLNTDPPKSPSSERLKRSSPPNLKEPTLTSKLESVHFDLFK
jgi:hypothetical protein